MTPQRLGFLARARGRKRTRTAQCLLARLGGSVQGFPPRGRPDSSGTFAQVLEDWQNDLPMPSDDHCRCSASRPYAHEQLSIQTPDLYASESWISEQRRASAYTTHGEICQKHKTRAGWQKARCTPPKKKQFLPEVQAPKSSSEPIISTPAHCQSRPMINLPKKAHGTPLCCARTCACVLTVWVAASPRRVHTSGGCSPQKR